MDVKPKFNPTPSMIQAAETLFLAMAYEQMLRPTVEEYHRKNLKLVGYGHLELKYDWTMPDLTFAEYNALNKASRDEIGLQVDDPEKCPLLVAEHLVSQAQNALIDIMEPLTGLDAHRLLCCGLDKYREYVELTLRLLSPFCKNPLTGEKI